MNQGRYVFSQLTDLLPSRVFDRCVSRKTKAAIKLHTLYDVKTSIPNFVHITNAATHDVHGLDYLVYEIEGFYILDRAYVDFERLYTIHQSRAYFVTRAKDNFRFTRMYSNKHDKSTGVRCDQIAKLVGYKSAKSYPEKLRRVKYYVSKEQRVFVYLTNNFELFPQEITLLYKYRWKVELFFKWIKQHLKIQSFWGTTPNAVKTQVYIAIITYTLVAIVKSKLKLKRSTYEILQILSVSLLDKTPLNELLTNQIYQDVKEQNPNQLKLSLF
ncbi:MAG: IS4 family transposase [Bacteroidota bacterium]